MGEIVVLMTDGKVTDVITDDEDDIVHVVINKKEVVTMEPTDVVGEDKDIDAHLKSKYGIELSK